MRRATAMVGAALACAALAAATGAPAQAAPKTRVYDVTLHLEGSRSWSYEKLSDDFTNGGCHEEERATGSERLQLQTPHPERVEIATGLPGQPPLFMGDTDAVLRLSGHHRLNGTHTDHFSGGCASANPDFDEDATDCGDRSMKRNVAFDWVHRDEIGLVGVTTSDMLRDHCPWGPIEQAKGTDDSTAPDISEVHAGASQRKVGRVRDFVLRGTTSWQGTVPSTDWSDEHGGYHVHGQEEVTWHWEAKFHQRVKKHRRHR